MKLNFWGMVILIIFVAVFAGCGKTKESPEANSKKDVILETPTNGAESASPLVVKGSARGMWYFEGSFPIKLIDNEGIILKQGVATAKGEWMTEDFVPFEAELPFNIEQDMDALLILERDNPSGLPENNTSISVPIFLKFIR